MRTMPNDIEDIFLACWNTMLGAFLMLAPWYLGYAGETAPTWNAWACGGAVIVLSLMALAQVHDWLEYAVAAVGLWLCAAPWALGFEDVTGPALTHVGFGFAMMVSAAAELWRLRHASGARVV